MNTDRILYEQHNGVITLRLNRPEVRNAVDRATVDALRRCVDRIAADPQARAVVLCGQGQGFCAGADLRELSRLSPADAGRFVGQAAEAMNRLVLLPLPVIASIHGFALGGGFLLSLYADVRVVASDARIGLPPAARAWMLPWAMSRLASWIGPARAQQFVLRGGVLTAEEMQRRGLVDEVVPPNELASRTQHLARDLATWPPAALSELRHFFHELQGHDHLQSDRRATEAFVRCLSTPEAQAAMSAFRKAAASPPDSGPSQASSASVADPVCNNPPDDAPRVN